MYSIRGGQWENYSHISHKFEFLKFALKYLLSPKFDYPILHSAIIKALLSLLNAFLDKKTAIMPIHFDMIAVHWAVRRLIIGWLILCMHNMPN